MGPMEVRPEGGGEAGDMPSVSMTGGGEQRVMAHARPKSLSFMCPLGSNKKF